MTKRVKSDRVEIKIVFRADVLDRLDAVAASLKTSRHALIEMLFCGKEHIIEMAVNAIHNKTLDDAQEHFDGVRARESNHVIRKTIEEIFKSDAKERRFNEIREKALLDEISNIEGARVVTTQEAICQFLDTRFGIESQFLQDIVRAINNLDALSRIMKQIFGVNKLDEAKALIKV